MGTESMPGEITMRSILGVAEMVHLQELEKRDEHIQNLQGENQRLEREFQELKQKFSEFRRSSADEKELLGATNQQKEQKLLVMQAKNKGLEAELAKAQQEIALRLSQVAQITSERDKANHIIRKLLNKPSYNQPTCHPATGRIFESSGELS